MFLLTKWYLDCVSDEGDLHILYNGSLRWRMITLHYSSILRCNSAGVVTTRTSLHAVNPPQITDDRVTWNPSSLGIGGSWNREAAPFVATLLESDEGSIEWNCMMPKARVELLVPGGEQIRGLGYVESIRMTIPPWRMPIDELRWGRFLSVDDTVVWIDWRGPVPKQILLHNGEEFSEATINDVTISFNGCDLDLDCGTVLRQGPLVSTALSSIPGVRGLFPDRILGAEELKWRSRGTLIGSTTEIPASGWGIHEVMRWR